MSSLLNSNEKDNNNEEEEVIISLMKEILQYEKKIKEVNNLLNNNNTNFNQSYAKLSELKQQKVKLSEKISEIEQNFAETLKNKDTQIKLKESMKNKIEDKIQEYKYKLNTLNTLEFKPIITNNIFPNNNKQNEILTNEQINDILLKSKNIKYSYENEPYNITNEIININKEQEKDLIENINKLKLKICQTDELLKMLKEEKYSTNNELINIISCKESIDALIKFNHYLIKNFTKEINKNNNLNEKDNVNENNDEEIYNKNKWTEPTKLFFYEISALDSDLFSIGFNDIIIDIYDINNMPFYYKNKTNLELSSLKTKKKSNNNSKKDINMINNIFSISKILKKEFEFFVKINKNNTLINYEIILKNCLEKISTIIINKLKLFLSKKFDNQILEEMNKNIVIYLSYYIKSLFYDKIINGNLKFINKEYKYNKKELKNISNELNSEIKQLEFKQKGIHHQINNNERELKISQNETLKKKLIDNLKNEWKENLTESEKEYLQLCSNINNLLLQKEEVNDICQTINNEFKTKKEKLEIEKNELNKEIIEVNKEIKRLEENLEQKKIKVNEEIIEYRKIIAEKYNKIKSQLKISKNKYGENTDQYNFLLNNINEKIKKMNNLDLTELDIIKFNSNTQRNKNNCENENIYKYTINSYEEDGKKFFNKFTNQDSNNIDSNNSEDKFYNLEFSTTKINNRSRYNYPINNKLKYNKERNYTNIYSSSKLQKHINYIDKYFSTSNSIKDNKSIGKKQKKPQLHLKSSTQLNFYPSFRTINNSISSSTKKSFNNNIYNPSSSYQKNSTKITSLFDKYSNNLPFYNAGQKKNLKDSLNINRTLRSFRNEKIPYNINIKENIYYKNNNNKNEDELSKTISELKSNIIKNKKFSVNFLEKIKILTKITFCFFRKINQNSQKYNPLNKISTENLCKSPYYFINSSISLNKSYNSIRIGLTEELDPIDINIKEIQFTVVSSTMKEMIEIYKDYKKYNKNINENCDKNSFVKKQLEKNSKLNEDFIKKCIGNKKFIFTLLVENNPQMEFLFLSYDDFKMWINGLAFIIKNKKNLLEYIGKI